MWTAVCRDVRALRASARVLAISLALAQLPVAAARAGEPTDYSKLPARSSPVWVRQGIIYEIFPRQFSTTGDFTGITAQLDRLQPMMAATAAIRTQPDFAQRQIRIINYDEQSGERHVIKLHHWRDGLAG